MVCYEVFDIKGFHPSTSLVCHSFHMCLFFWTSFHLCLGKPINNCLPYYPFARFMCSTVMRSVNISTLHSSIKIQPDDYSEIGAT